MAFFVSNIDDVIVDLEKELAPLVSSQGLNKLMTDVTTGLLRTMKRRIHQDGNDANGTPIGGGQYSTKPMYVNPSRGSVSIGLANKGKNGKSKFKNGKSHQTRYYSSGYKEWRTVNKKIVNKVNLEFKGDLRRDFTFQRRSNSLFTIGFSTYGSWEKAQGLTKKYKQPIWDIGTLENKIIDETVKIYLK